MGQALSAAVARGVDRATARALLGDILSCSALALLTEPDQQIGPQDQALVLRGIDQLAEGVPLSRLRGWREFWGLRFCLNEATLDPRPDSEVLIEAALAHLPSDRPVRVLDLGTGSGCLLLSLLTERPLAQGVGVDVSPRALEAARTNADQLGVKARADLLRSNWFEAVEGRFDLILCNPPYVAQDERGVMDRATLDHDPHSALFAQDRGLEHYRLLFASVRDFLLPNGRAIFEHGFRQQAALAQLAQENGLVVDRQLNDLGGQPRCLVLS